MSALAGRTGGMSDLDALLMDVGAAYHHLMDMFEYCDDMDDEITDARDLLDAAKQAVLDWFA